MTVHELIAILGGMPQHVEVVVQNLNNDTTHRVQGVHVKPMQGVVAVNVVNRGYEPGQKGPMIPKAKIR